MYHLGILSVERVRRDAPPGSICHVVRGFLGTPAGARRWLPSACFDGLHEDPDQAVLEKKTSSSYHGPGKAQAVLSACLLQMLGIWACPGSSGMVWLSWFGLEEAAGGDSMERDLLLLQITALLSLIDGCCFICQT